MKEIKLICKPLVAINGEIFEKDIVLYECQKDSPKVFNLTSKSDSDCKVRLQIDGEQAYFLLNDKNEESHVLDDVTLKSKETLEVPIYLKPGAKCGENPISIKAITDFSSLVGKKFKIKTKKSISPKPLFDFAYIDGDVYYIGEGNRKMGTLTITACKQEGCQNTDAYNALDLRDLRCNCEFIDIKPLGDATQTLPLGDSNVYDIYFQCNKKEDVQFSFSIDSDNKSKKNIINVKKPKDPIEKKEFSPVTNLRYDSLKENHIVGYLNTSVINTDKRGYFKREKGYFELTDRLHSFDYEGTSKKQVLEYGEHSYPIYANIEGLFGSIRDNIDEDKQFNIDNLSYSDSVTNNEAINAEYTVKHIEAHPSGCVSVIGVSGNESPIKELGEITLEEWTYDSIYATQISSANIFSLCLGNKQSLPCNGNGIIWEDIHIEGDGIIGLNIPRKEIRNGEQDILVPIRVEFDKIKDKSEIKVLFKCKELINDTDSTTNASHNIDCTIVVPIMEVIVDDWYSLDLGTTGIVVAKWNYESETGESDGISAIKLSDYEDALAIERSRNIVSSITILKPSSNNDKLGEVIVAPSTPELKQNAKYVLVPTKFMVGQNVLPFFNIYKMTFPDGLLINGEIYNWEAKTTEDKVITPKEILTHTYKTIFSKISEDECKRIRKLIITYPNTYTPESLDWLRDMIINSGIFENLSSNNLHFIPESDSVVAYYVKKSMERETNTASERVVIYDMGAGTLDLSYVKISIEEENGRRFKKSAIEKRIGIPIAGEYFSYLIYEDLKEKFTNNDVNYTTKAWIDDLKINYGNITKFNEVQGESLIKSEFSNEKISLGESINKWINICTEQALIKLLGNEWGNSVDRIVLSGRGSQFKPIQDKLKDLSETNGIILDLETITLSELKQCVAEGAILYQKIFENPSLPFSIVHRNSYEHIGIQYRILDEDFTKKWTYKELMNESHLIWDLTPKDGAIFAQVPSIVIENLDFSLDEDIVFYLTSLTESDMLEVIKNPGSEKEVFMNELFRFKPSVLEASGDRKECTLNLSIDSNNKLSISINSMDLLPHSTLPNVEDDKFYVKCNWYLN